MDVSYFFQPKNCKLGTLVRLVLLTLSVTFAGGCSDRDVASLLVGSQSSFEPEDVPVALIERRLVISTEGELPDTYITRSPSDFHPGASLQIKESLAASAESKDISTPFVIDNMPEGIGAAAFLHDVKDISVSYDGMQLLFALRMTALPGVRSTWNIMLYDIATDTLTRIIEDEDLANAGDDVSPRFLPDGKIIFSSNRLIKTHLRIQAEDVAGQNVNLLPRTEDASEFIFNLHIMESDGSDIEQVTFHPNHDLNPVIMPDTGDIIFSRWNNGFDNRDQFDLYKMRQDGTQIELLFGYHSHQLRPSAGVDYVDLTPVQGLPNDKLLVRYTVREKVNFSSEYRVVDIGNFTDNTQRVFGAETEQEVAYDLISNDPIRLSEGVSPSGRYASAMVLEDYPGPVLVSWSPCRLRDPDIDVTFYTFEHTVPCREEYLDRLGDDGMSLDEDNEVREFHPIYGLWSYTKSSDHRSIVEWPNENIAYLSALWMMPRSVPPIHRSENIDSALANLERGILHIRSVYDVDGVDESGVGIGVLADPGQTTSDERDIRFVRFVKSGYVSSSADLQYADIGGMRHILGYAPVEPDGSVKVQLPADVPFTIELLDANGIRISARHDMWMNVRPGETFECRGCHEDTEANTAPHGRLAAQPPSVNLGALNNEPFPNTIPTLLPIEGETMAEVYARIFEPRRLLPDIRFDDDWTDTSSGGTPDPSFEYTYSSFVDFADNNPDPTSLACYSNWHIYCRIVIHYEEHIHPLWNKIRVDGTDLDSQADTCAASACHAGSDPAGNLDFTTASSSIMYQRLFSGGQGGGEPVLTTDGANASTRFFPLFRAGGSHEGRLTGGELKLLAEWVDIGGQRRNSAATGSP